MIIATVGLLLLTAQGGEALPSSALGEFNHAAKCRVHAEMLPAVMAESPERQRWGKAVFAYWVKRSERLAQKAGLKPEETEIRLLMIPITADMDLINACIEEAKKDGAKA